MWNGYETYDEMRAELAKDWGCEPDDIVWCDLCRDWHPTIEVMNG